MPGPLGQIVDRIAGAAGGMDWSGPVAVALTGLVVGGVAFAIAIGVAYWIRHTEAASGASGAASAVASRGLTRFRRARGTADPERWLCARCRSWNPPGSDVCYRGCGRRADVRLLLSGEVERPAPAPADPDGTDRPGAPGGSDGSHAHAEPSAGAGERSGNR